MPPSDGQKVTRSVRPAVLSYESASSSSIASDGCGPPAIARAADATAVESIPATSPPANNEGTPVGNVFFAGEHTSSFYECQGFMEGAATSGINAAAEIVRAFRKGA